MFLELAEFQNRPDFRDHFRAWYMGEDLSKLPPIDVKEEEPVSAPEPEAQYPEGAHIFGGNYGSENRNGTEEAQTERAEDEAANQDPVPELQQFKNDIEDTTGNPEEGSLVSSLRDGVHVEDPGVASVP